MEKTFGLFERKNPSLEEFLSPIACEPEHDSLGDSYFVEPFSLFELRDSYKKNSLKNSL